MSNFTDNFDELLIQVLLGTGESTGNTSRDGKSR
jgi:hypothetical protein